MTTYSVYEPPGDTDDIEKRAEKIAFVKEGFNWVAFFLPALWLIFQRMWLELIVFLGVIAGVSLMFGTTDAGREMAGWATIALSILFAFEANDLRGWALERRGYRFSGVTSGRGRTEAERSFFTSWLPEQGRASRRFVPPPPPQKGTPSAPTRPQGGEEVIGSFPRA